ncbi:endocuticle structural glycoprotein SgAbd-1-like [Macrobrachium rosenbergii]|uniref:endocuticle structural glycoprotein SgAbd-1-like n=1 Tax=Macrobrachium rosenbergii TaxID=79674 RepID=UPI0034D5A012
MHHPLPPPVFHHHLHDEDNHHRRICNFVHRCSTVRLCSSIYITTSSSSPSSPPPPPPPPPPPSTTPSQLYSAPGASPKQGEVEAPPPVAIVKDERTQSEDGTFKFDFEGANGIIVSGSGSATGADGSVVQAGKLQVHCPRRDCR